MLHTSDPFLTTLRPLIKEKLQQGVTLVVDRYAFSGVAFTSAKPVCPVLLVPFIQIWVRLLGQHCQACRTRAKPITADTSHPGHRLGQWLHSGRLLRSRKARTDRLGRSLFPQFILTLNRVIIVLFHLHYLVYMVLISDKCRICTLPQYCAHFILQSYVFHCLS